MEQGFSGVSAVVVDQLLSCGEIKHHDQASLRKKELLLAYTGL